MGQAFLKYIKGTDGRTIDFINYLAGDIKGWSQKIYDNMDDLVDNTILHELVHTWIAKGKSPKQIAFNKSWMTPLGKAARRARRDKRRALWVNRQGDDSVMGLKTTWQLEKDVEAMVSNFKAAFATEVDEAKRFAGLQKFIKPSLNKTDLKPGIKQQVKVYTSLYRRCY